MSIASWPGSAAARGLEVDGYGEESLAWQTVDRNDILYHRQTLNLKVSERSWKNLTLRVEANFWRDDPDFQDGAEYRSRLREAHVRFRFRDFDLRLGRFLLAWGEADGVIVSDQIAPFDFTNFIVPPFDAIRMGVDGAALDYYFEGGDDLQVIWIAKFQRPDFPDLGSPWSFIDEGQLLDFDAVLAPVRKPPGTLHNSELGLRYSGHPSWMDWSFGYLHSIDDRPSLRFTFEEGEDDDGGTAEPVQTLTPTHRPFDVFTFNAVAPLASVLLRFDSAYEIGRYLRIFPDPRDPVATTDGLRRQFVDQHDVVRALVGVDVKPRVPYWEQADASFQFVREQVLDAHPALAEPAKTNRVTALLRAAYRNETVKPWLFVSYNLDGADTWLQAKVDYEPRDAWRLSLEYDFFTGHAFRQTSQHGGLFGGFDANDMLMATLRRSF